MKNAQSKRPAKSPGTPAYYETLRSIFEIESKILTAVLPHKGERGRNDEERCRALLGKVLPRRFSVGTGFVVSSAPGDSSRQTDVVIFDEVWNAPLHREFAALVYPIESVYGTVEVKAILNKSGLVKALEAIAAIRNLAENKQYVSYGGVPVAPDRPGDLVVAKNEYTFRLAPRAYIFAYDAIWKSFPSFMTAMNTALLEVPDAHVHGVVVLSKNWWASQDAYTGSDRRVSGGEKDSLLEFIKCMTMGLSSFHMAQANIDRYLATD